LKNKFLAIVGGALLLLLAACGAKSQTTDSGNTSGNSQDKVNKEKEELTVTIVDEAFESWERNDAFMISYSAELKNENDVPVDIQRMYVEFLNEEGEVFEGLSFDPIPNILMPNETAYVVDSYEIRDDEFTDPATLKGVAVEMEIAETDDERVMLETDDVQFELFHEADSLPYKVTGVLKNPHDKVVKKVEYAAGLYNDQGELLAVLRRSAETNLGKGDSTEFETFYPYLTNEIYGKVTNVKTIAYKYPY